MDLCEQRSIQVVGHQQGRIFSRGHRGSLSRSGVYPGHHALVGVFAQLPQNYAHGHRSYEKKRKQDDLVARNHG